MSRLAARTKNSPKGPLMLYRVVQFTDEVSPLPLNPDVSVTLSGLFMIVLKETDADYTGYIFYNINGRDYGIEIVIGKHFTRSIGYTPHAPHLTSAETFHLN
jgi:hypothetical protein